MSSCGCDEGEINSQNNCRKSNICNPEGKLASKINTNMIIQGACRVPSSLYTMSRASISVANNEAIKHDKHGSYARYLARLKGKSNGPLRTQEYNANAIPVQGNKTRMIGLIPNCELCS